MNRAELLELRRAKKAFERALPILELRREQCARADRVARHVLLTAHERLEQARAMLAPFAPLLVEDPGFDFARAARPTVEVERTVDAGAARVEVTALNFDGAVEHDDTVRWSTRGLQLARAYVEAAIRHDVAQRNRAAAKRALQKATRKVNLFERRRIPETAARIRVVEVSLFDADIAATVRAKIARRLSQRGRQEAS